MMSTRPGLAARVRMWFDVPPPGAVQLAVFRIALGVMVLWDACERIPTAHLFLAEDGFFPRAFQDVERPSLFSLFGDGNWSIFLLVIYGLCGLALAIGFRPRLAAFLGWFLILSLHHRNPYVTNGGDFFLRVILLWTAFLPTGGALTPWRQTSVWSRGVWAVYRLQVSVVYLITAAHKALAGGWLVGDALERSLRYVELTRPLAEIFLQWEAALHPLGVAVVLVQFLAGFGLLLRSPLWRGIAVAWIAAMQISFLLVFNLGFFPWIGLVSLLPLVPIPHPAPEVARNFDWRGITAICAGTLTFLYAVASLGIEQDDSTYERAFQLVGLNQRWPMFSHPSSFSSRLAVVVRDRGRPVDLIALDWAGDGELRGREFAFPGGGDRLYATHRWGDFLDCVARDELSGGRSMAREIAHRIGSHFARKHPELSKSGWSVVVFSRLNTPDASEEADDREVLARSSGH